MFYVMTKRYLETINTDSAESIVVQVRIKYES